MEKKDSDKKNTDDSPVLPTQLENNNHQALSVKIATVIPISRGVFKEELSYFTSLDIKSGDIVKIPVRNKTSLGIITNLAAASETKIDIKKSDFELKKILDVVPNSFLRNEFVEAAHKTAKFFATNTGQAIASFVPQIIVEHALEKGLSLSEKSIETYKTTKNPKHEIRLIQATDDERLSFYRSIIRESLAQKTSTFLCLPTTQDVERMVVTLGKGIEQYIVVLHGSITPKEILKRWKKALAEERPLFIIGTPMFLSLPRHDIGTIILEQESSEAYKARSRPLIDNRIFVENLARELGIKLIIGDLVLRIETIYRHEANGGTQVLPVKRKFNSAANHYLVNLQNSRPSIAQGSINKEEFIYISKELREILINSGNKNSFLLVARKGLAPSTICCDCGKFVLCDKCDYPLSLKRFGAKNIFVCNQCKTETPSERKCSNCLGWRLKTLGVGIERVEQEIKKVVPNKKIFRIDGDSTPDHKKASEIASEFLSEPGSILLGTSMAIPYLPSQIDNTAVVSLDSLFFVPEFRMSEKIFGIVTRTRLLAIKNFVFQTRKPEEKIIERAFHGDFAGFYREELELRKELNYPPFSVLIKISRTGQRGKISEEITELETFLKKYKPTKYYAGGTGSTDIVTANLLIKIDHQDWPEKESIKDSIEMNLIDTLKNLPPRFVTDIEPRDLI
ncbi:MAG: hypothetical protein WC797_00880 [Candidatus Paceibacterota bacterium]|jgi:primosomal protein N' (replication factor Y)